MTSPPDAPPTPPPTSGIPDRPRRDREPISLTWAQLQSLADDFDLGRLVQMDRPIHTQCNTTDPFRTGRGTFLLRARHGEEFVERLEYLHTVMDRLAQTTFPCARVVRSPKGKSWTKWGDRLVEIHTFVEHDAGAHRGWNRILAAAIALGDLHGALQTATGGVTPVPPEMRNDVSPAQCWAMLQDVIQTIEQITWPDPRAERAMEICTRISELLYPLLKDHERAVGQLPWLIVHGDYHFWNILYQADEIVAVVDFDFLQERERIFDLAYAMRNIVAHTRSLAGSAARDPRRLDWPNARLWVDLYDQSAPVPLTQIERQMLPREMLRVFLVAIVTAAHQGDPLSALPAMTDELETYAWLAQHPSLFT